MFCIFPYYLNLRKLIFFIATILPFFLLFILFQILAFSLFLFYYLLIFYSSKENPNF